MSSNGVALSFETFTNTINGKQVSTSKTRHGINPATEEANPEVPVATEKDVDDAVQAAIAAQPGWAATPLEERRKAIVAFAEAIDAHKAEFAKMLTQEQGKPVSRSELLYLEIVLICAVDILG